MTHALIISNNVYMASVLSAGLIAAGWKSEHINLSTLLNIGSHLTQHHHFALLHIDQEFIKRFSGVIDEMSAMVKNCASYLPVYLTFEQAYDHRFYLWRLSAKRLFEFTNSEEKIKAVIEEISKLESRTHDARACVSPTGLV